MFKFKKEVERFIFSEEGKIPHQKAILAGLLAFALSIGQARANDTTFKGCRANAGANDITFWLHLSDDGITDETHSIDIPNPFGTDPAKTLGALGLLNVPDSEQYSLLSSTLEQGSVHVSDHISGTHHWYGGSCRNDDHFSSDFTVPLSGDVVYHQNALNIRESDTGL
ncbi:MAG: hypothetical protein KJ574_04040, partial [Nanoarchaeota archaeon]|nr:hypothetical protein [Nanoarchaeota archaeon]